MSKFVTLGDVCLRLDEIVAFERDRCDVTGRMMLEVSLRHDQGSYWDIHDESGELFAKLKRAMEAG